LVGSTGTGEDTGKYKSTTDVLGFLKQV
jgi:hypothetical protein